MKFTVTFNINCSDKTATAVAAAMAEAIKNIEKAGARGVRAGIKPRVAFEAAIRNNQRANGQEVSEEELKIVRDGRGGGKARGTDSEEANEQIAETIARYHQLREEDPKISLLSVVKQAIDERKLAGKPLPFKSVSSLYYRIYRDVKGGKQDETEKK